MTQKKCVLIGYSSKNKQFFNAFKHHLAPCNERDYLDVWSDERVETTQNSDREIHRAIESAAVAVLLISQELLDSDCIWKQELPVLLNASNQGKIKLFCLYLNPLTINDADWAAPPLSDRESVQASRYQVLNDPDNPVSKLNDYERQRLFRKAGQTIRTLAGHREISAKTDLVAQPVPLESPPQTARDSEDEIRIVTDIPRLLEMIELPGGTFLMGSSASDQRAYDDERPQHQVTISGFALARFPVTRELYREIVGKAPARWEDDSYGRFLPANHLSWFDAVQFCNALSEQQGLRPCYSQQGLPQWDSSADGYRLPTEAEWEYAVRAGTATQWFFGNDSAELDCYAWFTESLNYLIHPVGEKKPNPWGFHDLIGNVWEWCWDWYGDYLNGPAIDPAGPENGEYRVVRGGVYWVDPRNMRSADRGGDRPADWLSDVGFRLVRAVRCHT